MKMDHVSKIFCLALQIPKKKYTAYEVIIIFNIFLLVIFEGERESLVKFIM